MKTPLSFLHRLWAIGLLVLLTGCVRYTSLGEQPTGNTFPTRLPAFQIHTPSPQPPPVQLRWFYADKYRIGVELNVRRQVPSGFHIGLPGCAVSEITLADAHHHRVLFRFPKDGQEWNGMWWQTRWSCRRLEGGSFLVSIAAFSQESAAWPLEHQRGTLTVALGSLPIASDSGNSPPRALPAAGTFQFQVVLQPPPFLLTWEKGSTLSRAGVEVTLERVARNPSAAWMDACITYPDHHFWKVTGAMQTPTFQTEAEGVPLAPAKDWSNSAKALASHRCFTLPFTLAPYGPIAPGAHFRIGIERLRINNINPAWVTARAFQ